MCAKHYVPQTSLQDIQLVLKNVITTANKLHYLTSLMQKKKKKYRKSQLLLPVQMVFNS